MPDHFIASEERGDRARMPPTDLRRSAAAELRQERITDRHQLSLQALRAIAGLAGPRLGSVIIPALPAIMRVLHLDQIEVLLPVGSLFLEGSRTIANLNPAGSAVLAKSGFAHVPQVLAFGYGTIAQGSVFNRLGEETVRRLAGRGRASDTAWCSYFTCAERSLRLTRAMGLETRKILALRRPPLKIGVSFPS
jgi:hypothetical protein